MFGGTLENWVKVSEFLVQMDVQEQEERGEINGRVELGGRIELDGLRRFSHETKTKLQNYLRTMISETVGRV